MKRLKRSALAVMLVLGILACGAVGAMAESEALPTVWNLESIYASVEEWQADYDSVMGMLDACESYRGTLNTAQNIYDFFQFAILSEMPQKMSKLGMYVSLGNSLDPTDAVFLNLQSQLSAMTVKFAQDSAFVDPEIYALPLEKRVEIFSDPLFEGWAYALRDYVNPDAEPFSEEVSQALVTKSIGDGYAEQIFNILNSVEVPEPVITMPDGTQQPLTDALYDDICYSGKYDDEFKAQANQLILTKPKGFVHTFAALLEENALQAYAAAQLANYDTTREYALSAYDLDPEVYDMLIEAAHDGAGEYRRYLAAHARGLGLTEQYPYQTAETVSDFNPGKMDYEDAVAEVEEALSVLGEDYIDQFDAIIKSGQVDVYPTDTKVSGAFETRPSLEYLPWVLFNYSGYSRDVSTIAHEMGHAMYEVYAGQNQPVFYASPTSFTQEIASTTNELLYYTYKMEHAENDDEKLYYLENLLEMFSGTFFSQMLYAEFEDMMYQNVEAGGALDAEMLSDTWTTLLELYRGDTVIMYPDGRYNWATVPHFYYVYYVYQYAADVCYAASIVERITAGEAGAVEDYLSFLKLGASDSPVELLKTAGIDLLSEKTYKSALAYFSGLVDEYERLIDAR